MTPSSSLPTRAGMVAGSIGGVVLIGWALDAPFVEHLNPAWPSMKANTALGLILAGLSLALLAPGQTRRGQGLVGRTFALALGLLAIATLASYVLRWHPGIDQILFRDRPTQVDVHGPGRMAPITALNLLLLALALSGLDFETRGGQRPAQYLALLGGASSLVAILGYLYSTPATHRFSPFASVALHTAVALFLLWTGVLFARPRAGFMAEITAESKGGGLARRILPPAVLACALLGLLRVLGERAGYYSWEFGVALFAASNIVVFGGLVWEGARWLNRVDLDRQRAQREGAASEERFRRFFEDNLAGTCITRPDGTLLDCNPAFLRIFGFETAEQAQTTNVADLYADPSKRLDVLTRMQQERQFKNLELEMRRRDGRLVSLVVDFVGAFDESGKLVEIHGYAQDVTEQRRVELQLQRAQKMEAVGQLAGGIAHDFNNLLGVMGGYAELVLRDLGQEHRSARRVGGILKAVERASALTRQLLTFSRHQPVETRVCDLNAVVENVEKMLRRLLGEDVRLVVALHHEIARVKADVGQLEQVIVNLAVNARDAMPDGGRLVIETGDIELDEHYTRTHPEAHPGSHVLLAVSDTGQGMDTQTVSRIFEPFFTTKAPGKGTGLGLSMVYGIVKRFGGHVAVYSEPGRGTTFKVYLPSVREGEAALPSEQAPRGAPPGGTETILLLEDDEALRSVIAETLRSSGYYVLEAPDADAALALAANAERPPQLLITDVVLPLRGGPVAAAELQARLPGVRVLFMSGYTDRTVERTGGIPVASHFLQKPFTNDALLWRVRAILDEPAIR